MIMKIRHIKICNTVKVVSRGTFTILNIDTQINKTNGLKTGLKNLEQDYQSKPREMQKRTIKNKNKEKNKQYRKSKSTKLKSHFLGQ